MSNILNKAQRLIERAKNDEDFHSEHANDLIGTGERSVDYCLYQIDLSDEYFMLIDFTDFSLKDFSLIHKSHQGIISNVETTSE